MRVLITRPEKYGLNLAEKIKPLGFIPELLPTIHFQPTLQQPLLQTAIEQLDRIMIAIFVSQAAVDFSFPLIKATWQPLPDIQWAAIGAATAQALQQQGIQTIILPENPPYESESLLAHPALQTVTGKHIFIFRGNGGRDLLSRVLTGRDATVTLVEVYERSLPRVNMAKKFQHWQQHPPQVIVTTSAQSLHNLMILASHGLPGLKDIPLVVVGLRMHELANTLEFKKPVIALGADDASIIKVLTKLKDQAGENNHF